MSQPRTIMAINTPRVSFSTLAKLMGPCTPVAQVSLLRGHKYPTDGPKRSYQNAQKRVIAHLANGQSLSSVGLRDHEREAVDSIIHIGISLPHGVTAARPATQRLHWTFHGVDISVFPDVDLDAGGSAGALKVHFNKDSLPRGVGATMAALLHHYKTNVLGFQNVSPRHCLVYEARTGALHACGGTSRLLTSAQAACQLISALWPSL